jgi:ABC-type branched-subunit amino acid transport system ATPase component
VTTEAAEAPQPAAGPKGAAILETRAARKEFGGLVACSDIDFVVPERSIVSLIGPNGAGKTTFFNMLTGAYKPTSGEILFAGRDVGGLPPHRITKLGVGRTFQNIRLFQTMTSIENVLVGMHCRLKGGLIRSILRTPASGEERDALVRGASCCATAAFRARRRRVLDEPVLRRSAPAGGGARARQRAEAAPAGRADRGHEPAGVGRLHRFGRSCGRARLTILLIEHDMKVVMGVSERITMCSTTARRSPRGRLSRSSPMTA